MSINPGANWPASYFAPRDFEIVQPLYDLAFLLQVVPLAKKAEVSKYRSLSLGKVAHSLDSYSTGISQWINGELADQDVDYIPTPRIKKYLATILANGTLDELSSSFSESARGCSRLRSIRGLGKKIIAEFLSESPNISEKLLIKASKKSGLTGDQILAVFAGETYGTWQSAHVIPPLMRLLHTVENECKHPLRYRISGLIDEVSPIEAPFQVFLMSDSSQIDHRAVARAISGTPFFFSGKKREGVWSIQHDMGWYFELIFTESCKSDLPLLNLMSRFDPLLRDLPKEILSDLHMHTSWSDGITTPAELVAAAARSGLQYVAITDHSQSSKIQKGLKSAVWLRQSIALKNAVLNCPVLHGLEVDILRDGRLDTPAGLLNGMDIVIGSFHVGLKQSRASNTERLFKALESGQIDVIGHPTTKLVGRPGEPNYLRPPIEADWDAIIDKCVKWRVALEINCFPSRLDIGGELLKKAVDAGCWLSVGTDAHARLHLNAIKYGAAMISKYGGAKLLNSLSSKPIFINQAIRVFCVTACGC